jgi:hypothetical protein
MVMGFGGSANVTSPSHRGRSEKWTVFDDGSTGRFADDFEPWSAYCADKPAATSLLMGIATLQLKKSDPDFNCVARLAALTRPVKLEGASTWDSVPLSHGAGAEDRKTLPLSGCSRSEELNTRECSAQI